MLAANGVGIKDFWASLVEGRTGIGYITHFDTTNSPCKIAGEITHFDPQQHLRGPFKFKREARHTQLALAAAQMALDDAGLSTEKLLQAKPLQLAVGISSSAFDLIESGMRQLMDSGPRHVTPFVVRSSPPQAASSALANYLGVPVSGISISTACAAGLDAIGQAAALIRSGRADIALAGAADAPITELAFATFASAGLVSEKSQNPGEASRPFDARRDSGVISEGAGFVVLENLEHARMRGAAPYAEITGYATQVDDDYSRPGHGLADTMRGALANAGRLVTDVDYVCAHGPGHLVLDRIETEAIKQVLGEHAYRVPVSSIKGCTGNALSASGPQQVVAACLALRNQVVPPTANYESQDPLCDLDYVGGRSRHVQVHCVVVNTHGIGGPNSSLVLENRAL